MPSVNGLGSGQINQTPNVSLRNPVGNVGDKTVQENHRPVLADSTKLNDSNPTIKGTATIYYDINNKLVKYRLLNFLNILISSILTVIGTISIVSLIKYLNK